MMMVIMMIMIMMIVGFCSTFAQIQTLILKKKKNDITI